MTSEPITDKRQIPWYRRPVLFTLIYVFLMPVGLIILWTGPNYSRAKGGGYSRIGKGTKWLLSILGVFIVLFGLARAVNDAAKDDSAGSDSASPSDAAANSGALPHMQVQTIPQQLSNLIKVTGDDDQPFTVERIVANGRTGEEGCDSLEKNYGDAPRPAVKLKRGDAITFLAHCGDSIMSVDIYTDKGKGSFEFKNGN